MPSGVAGSRQPSRVRFEEWWVRQNEVGTAIERRRQPVAYEIGVVRRAGQACFGDVAPREVEQCGVVLYEVDVRRTRQARITESERSHACPEVDDSVRSWASSSGKSREQNGVDVHSVTAGRLPQS
jgi:hypothetical protein